MNWLFCGSFDGIHYDIISIHKNDKQLINANAYDTVIFPIKNNKKFYKMFQIKINGKNNSNNYYETCKWICVVLMYLVM